MADYIYILESRMTPAQQKAIALAQETARAHGMNVYLTGGAIRDMISGFPIRDIDLTVEGNPQKLQKDLEKGGAVLEGEDEELREQYWRFAGNVRASLNMARAEKFGKAGKPPEIEPAAIMDDLRRRVHREIADDFSVLMRLFPRLHRLELDVGDQLFTSRENVGHVIPPS